MTNQICGRFLKICKAMEQSDNMKVHYLTTLSTNSTNSIIGFNMWIICRRLDNTSQLMNMGSCMLKKTYIQECIVEDHIALSLIQDHITLSLIQDHIALSLIQKLKGCMSGTYCINSFDFYEIDTILEYM